MRKTLLLAGAAGLLLAAACGGDELDVGSFAVDGRWAGTVRLPVPQTEDPADSALYVFDLQLEQSERDISGSGEIRTDAESVDVSVDGRWDVRELEMVLRAPEFASVVYQASFATRDTLKGAVTGSGFSGASLDLVRQPAAAP